MTLGNTMLVEYGIQTEDSDLRAHVCVNAKTVYVFPTKLAVPVILSGQYKSVPVTSFIRGRMVTTAVGYPIPVMDIPGIIPIGAKYFIDRAGFSLGDSTSDKGDKAVEVVQAMLRKGWFPLPCDPDIVEDIKMQQQGLDIVVTGRHRIQVKCDYRGGMPVNAPAVTGNLFLQFAECNPLKAA